MELFPPLSLKTKDFCQNIAKAEIEDLLRETLITVVKSEYDKDLKSICDSQPNRPIVDIFTNEIPDFPKYKLAKAYIKWTKNNKATSLTTNEIENWKQLILNINKVLK